MLFFDIPPRANLDVSWLQLTRGYNASIFQETAGWPQDALHMLCSDMPARPSLKLLQSCYPR